MPTENTFKLGICMAGAVSAGAYTAGVMDYLLEALEEWEKRKNNGDPNVPTHKVEIPVIGGASAGGITSVVTAAALYDPIQPVQKLDNHVLAENPNNKLYHTWVDLTAEDMLNVMLDNNDIGKSNLKSILNSSFIDKIADRAIRVNGEKLHQRSYISKNLKVFATLSNLEGMDFSVTFKSNSFNRERYLVNNHSDFACFMLTENESEYKKDGWMPLNFKSGLNVKLAKDSAIATGAFPVGFPAKTIVREGKYLNDHQWFKFITEKARKPFSESYSSINVDGGMINNEPFEKLSEIILEENSYSEKGGDYSGEDYKDFEKFRGTVTMIDPFPSDDKQFNNSDALSTVMSNTLSALLDQSRLKPLTLIDALDDDNAAQFLIAPVRYYLENGEKIPIEGKNAIACGSLGGFGGFISKEFRVHDYFLGRMNCEKFLRDYFTVPADTKNPIFKDGYENLPNKEKFMSNDGRLQIIPIFTEAQPHGYMPTFANGTQYP